MSARHRAQLSATRGSLGDGVRNIALLSSRVAALGAEAIVVGLGQAATLIASIAVTKVLASTLGEEEYGRYALAMTTSLLLQQFAFGPASQAGSRFYPEHASAGTLPVLWRVLFGWMTRISVTAVVLGLAAAVLLGLSGVPRWPLLVIFGLAAGLSQNYQGLISALQAAGRRRVVVALFQACEPAARAVAAFLLLRWMGASASIAVASAALGSGAVALIQWHVFRRSVDIGAPIATGTSTAATADAMRVYAANFAVWGLFSWAQQISDRWSLEAFVDTESVGIYVAAFQLASVPTLIAGAAVSQFIFPIAFGRAGDAVAVASIRSAARAVHMVTALFAVWLIAVLLLFRALGAELLVLFTAEGFRAGAAFLPTLLVGLGLMQIGQLLSLVPLSAKDLTAYRSFRVGHSVAAVLLNIAGGAVAGARGVVTASVVVGATYLVGVALINRSILREAPPIAAVR